MVGDLTHSCVDGTGQVDKVRVREVENNGRAHPPMILARTMFAKFSSILFALAWLLPLSLAQAQQPQQDGQKLAEMLTAINDDEWQMAARISAGISDDSARIYLDWRRLRAGQGEWPEYVKFASEHSDWPGLPLLRRVGEPKIPAGRPPTEIAALFDNDAPQTGYGALRYVQALESLNRNEDAQNALKSAWLTLPMNQSDHSAFVKRYGKTLAALHWARADAMLWDGEGGSAQRMLPLLSNAQRRLTEARIALRAGRNGVNKMIDAIPKSLANDPGLAFERFRWRMRRDLYPQAQELIEARSSSRENLGEPEVWSDRRRRIARHNMRDANYKAAYELASKHFLQPDEAGFTDLEWLSGYLALVYLKRPNDAVTHFRRLRQASVTPITQGRVWYWLGRAHDAAGNREKALEAWSVAASYQTSFYGQLAKEAGGLPAQSLLTGQVIHEWQTATFLNSTVFRAGLLLHYAGQRYSGGRFFAHLAETMTLSEQEQLGQLLIGLNRPNMALRVAKNGAALGRVVMPAYYPVLGSIAKTTVVPPEFALAIARQETEFNPEVQSPAGARGLMQLMPATARGVSKTLGLPYKSDRLITDPDYNIRLGTEYLRQMLSRFDGSYVLAAAAYNAGPQRANSWIKRFGDPRNPNVDAIAWIEKIPFRETRNYVMRVVESTGVYRARLSGRADAVSINADLNRGGS